MEQSQLSRQFKVFEKDCKGSSAMYELLSRRIAQDEHMLKLCQNVRHEQPAPNILFGAIHYLLLKGEIHPLKEYYPSISQHPRHIDEPNFFYSFKDFSSTYEDDIISIMKNKLVQTNEVRRCAYLYPIFCWIYTKIKKPLSLIEIGTSAGLQLLWDQLSYSYGNEKVYGNEHSHVHLTSEIRGKYAPCLLQDSPPVISKVGVDLQVSDLNDEEDLLWLKALIWPEHRERRELLEKAAECLQENPVTLIEGDGVALLPDIVQSTPKNSALCIFHTHVANQMPEENKVQLENHIRTIGRYRDVFHIYNNMWDGELHLDYVIDGIEHHKTIGETDSHGRWFEWNLEDTY